MTETLNKTLKDLISKQGLSEIDANIKKYPADNKQSAVMRALTIVQEEKNHLTEELMNAVAKYLEMPTIAVYEVATFYSMYEHEPVGENLINVCRSISCYLRGSDEIIKTLENHLGVKCGGTSADGKFTLKKAECLGACVHAPMMQINQKYHENLTTENVQDIIDSYQ
ncbi:MAG: NADH-quinone oxidoreductase subunit NuoE [Gammaproteobacteria bacterium]|nr:NADH-quinone oxidoreductase subunit NuoE [Gammaproteobacteria bacterium]